MPRKKIEKEPEMILEPEVASIVDKPPKKARAPRKKKPMSCWDVCKHHLDPLFTDDSVHICLGNVFVTRCQLERMMVHNSEEEKK